MEGGGGGSLKNVFSLARKCPILLQRVIKMNSKYAHTQNIVSQKQRRINYRN